MAAGVNKFERPTLADLNKVLELNPDKALAVQGSHGLQVGSFVLTPVGMEMLPGATFAEWSDVGKVLKQVRKAYTWLVIDWLIHGEREWGETYRQTAEQLGYKVESLHNYVSVGRRVEISRRREELDIGHHDAVAALSSSQQVKWLGYAVENKLSVQDLRDAIAGINRPALPTGKDPISRFQRALFPFERRLPRLLKTAGQGDRERMAAELRNLAERIERGELG